MEEPKDARPRKRQGVKAAKPPGDAKVKATIHLSPEASQRLSVHATMMNMDRSELVEQLIRENLRRFVVSDRGGAPEGSNSPDKLVG